MNTAVAAINLLIGVVYTSYGVMTIVDLWRNRHVGGASHFGYAWVAMAFTCGPHHFEHGLHLYSGGHSGGPADLLAIVVGLPAGLIWFALRLEAAGGGRGDRWIDGTPGWVEALPTLSGMYLVVSVTIVVAFFDGPLRWDVRLLTNVALVLLYCAIGAVLLRTQLRNHRIDGGWSLSGLALTAVFPTCALMHGAWALYAASGRYEYHWHLTAIDVMAVPAAVYFLWVVAALYYGTITERGAAGEARPLLVPDDDRPVELAGV